MILIISITTAKPGQREAILEIFRSNAPNVHAEEGCLDYGVYTDMLCGPAMQMPYGADTFSVIEKWASTEALAAHIAAPHTNAYREHVKDLVASREIRILTPT